MKRGRKPGAIRKNEILGIRTTPELADCIRAIAFMKGESMHEWLARVAAPEMAAAGVQVFNITLSEMTE